MWGVRIAPPHCNQWIYPNQEALEGWDAEMAFGTSQSHPLQVFLKHGVGQTVTTLFTRKVPFW